MEFTLPCLTLGYNAYSQVLSWSQLWKNYLDITEEERPVTEGLDLDKHFKRQALLASAENTWCDLRDFLVTRVMKNIS